MVSDSPTANKTFVSSIQQTHSFKKYLLRATKHSNVNSTLKNTTARFVRAIYLAIASFSFQAVNTFSVSSA